MGSCQEQDLCILSPKVGNHDKERLKQMELVAIQLARVAAFLEILSLDPKGRTTAPEGIAGFGKYYAFAKIPGNIAEMDFQKGVQFLAGHFNDIAIDQIQLFNNGISIDTRSSTDNCML